MRSEVNNTFSLSWWKVFTIVLLAYGIIAGFLSPVPRLAILNETIRNLYFHVPMWFGMTFFLLVSCTYSIMYLRTQKEEYDLFSVECANTGFVFGILGLLTGMLWAKFTWGTLWSDDPKLNAAAVGMFMYSAYFILRDSFIDDQQKAKVSAIYNILAFPAFVAVVYILPRLTDSLHPGNGGNPGFNTYDRDKNMNLIFYASGLGFILLGIWITTLRVRLIKIQNIIRGIN